MTCVAASAGEEMIKDSQGMDCFVYTPDPVDAAKTYQLVVGVHGARGKGNGAAGMADWAKRGDVIVIGPSFDTKNENPFQNGDGIHADKLIALFEGLGKHYKLRDKMFLHGFSAGSQFVHRFAMNHPKHSPPSPRRRSLPPSRRRPPAPRSRRRMRRKSQPTSCPPS